MPKPFLERLTPQIELVELKNGDVLPGLDARGLFELGGHFQLIILRFSHLLTRRISQSAAFYRYHSVEQLFCRWLLTYVDKAGENQIRITHEAISHFLGVHRESITELLGKLQKAGLVVSGRARLEVHDHAALEARCCECYSTVKRDIEATLPPSRPH